MTVAAYQPPAAPPAGPRVIDLEKLKDNLYVLTELESRRPHHVQRR